MKPPSPAMNYEYAAKSATGATLKGSLPAVSLQDLQRQLRERGLFVLSAKSLGTAQPRLSSRGEGGAKRITKPRVDDPDLAVGDHDSFRSGSRHCTA